MIEWYLNQKLTIRVPGPAASVKVHHKEILLVQKQILPAYQHQKMKKLAQNAVERKTERTETKQKRKNVFRLQETRERIPETRKATDPEAFERQRSPQSLLKIGPKVRRLNKSNPKFSNFLKAYQQRDSLRRTNQTTTLDSKEQRYP